MVIFIMEVLGGEMGENNSLSSVFYGITHKQRVGKFSSIDETFCFEMSQK